MTGAAAPPNASAGLETLKRLKEAEVDWETRLRAVVAEGAKALADAKSEAEAAVHAARVETDRAREAALSIARTGAEAEAAKILADGERAAKSILSSGSKDLGSLRDKVLDVVVGEFRKNGSRPEP